MTPSDTPAGTPTPRTDDAEADVVTGEPSGFVSACYMRELERELAAAKAQLAEGKADWFRRGYATARQDMKEECAKACESRIEPGTTGVIDEERDAEARACAADIRALKP